MQSLVAVSVAVTAHATEFHVATSGLDTNTCNRTTPLRTIRCAADLTQPTTNA